MTFQAIGDGLLMSTYRQQQQMWTRGKTRRDNECRICQGLIEAGTLAYRPLSNRENRWWRIHVHCATRCTIG